MPSKIKSGKLLWCLIIVVELAILFIAYFSYSRRDVVELNYTQEDLLYNNGDSGFYLDQSYDYSYIATPEIILPKGLYTVEVQYERSDSSAVALNVKYLDNRFESDAAGKIILSHPNHIACDFRVKYGNRPIQLSGRLTGDANEGDYLLIRSVKFTSSPYAMRNFLFNILVFFMLADILLLIYIMKDKFRLNGENLAHFKVLLFLVFLSSLPLMVNYLLSSAHDMPFHLVRIEGLKSGLEAGMFPVRIQPSWLDGHGYAVSVFYGDFFLYFFALLRIFAVSIQTVYKLYIIFVNCLTVFISYHCFSKMSNHRTGLACTVLYSLNIYRLICIYTRGAMGEYTAMAFMPLVLYGLWKAYMLPEDTKEHEGSWITITLGCTGIFLSHIISTELTAFFIIVSAIVLWKKTFRKKTFMVLLKAVFATFFLNLWFLVPFLDYMMSGTYVINNPDTYIPYHMEERGVFPAQLFMLDYSVVDGSKPADAGSVLEMPITVGIASLLVLVVWYLICFCKKERNKEEKRKDFLPVFLSVLSLFMTTYLFPYTWLVDKVPVLSIVARSIQYPWRCLSVSAVLIAWLFCTVLQKDWISQMVKGIFAGMIVILSIGQGLSYMSKCLNDIEPVRIFQEGNLSNYSVSGGEYIPIYQDGNYSFGRYKKAYVDGLSYNSDEIIVEDWHREKAKVLVSLTNTADNTSRIEVPLLLYKGYHAYSDSGEEMSISPGESYRISVSVPQGFNGSFVVEFKEPWYWRMCEIISLLVFGGIIVYIVLASKQQTKPETEAKT